MISLSKCIIVMILIFIFIWSRCNVNDKTTNNQNTQHVLETFKNNNYSFSNNLISDLTKKTQSTKKQTTINKQLEEEEQITGKSQQLKAGNNYNYTHKKINGNDVIRFTNLNIKIMSKEEKHKKKLYYYRKFRHFIRRFSISDEKKASR